MIPHPPVTEKPSQETLLPHPPAPREVINQRTPSHQRFTRRRISLQNPLESPKVVGFPRPLSLHHKPLSRQATPIPNSLPNRRHSDLCRFRMNPPLSKSPQPKKRVKPKLYERCQNALKESQSYGNPKRMRMKLPCKFQTGMQVSRGEVMYGLDENFHTTSLQHVPFGDRPDRILLPHINLRYAVEDEKVEPDCRLMSWLQTMNE